MVPGDQHIYGVKTPQLNQLAKQFTPESFTLVEELWNSGSLEEQIIAINDRVLFLNYAAPDNGDCDNKAMLTWNNGNNQRLITLP